MFVRSVVTAALFACTLAAPAFARNPTAQERADIENLAYRYLFALDWRDAETYANTFAPDGVLNYGGGKAVGRAEIAAVVQRMREREMANLKPGETGQGSGHGQHVVTAMVIDIAADGRSAVAQAYWVHVMGVEPRLTSYGHYVDRLVRIGDEWLYSARRTYNEQSKGRETLPFVNPVTHPERYDAELAPN
ncbi:MAG: nuclear transport factor 2 family protein [Gammaproteobacteria bacterium]|nr:nuclear transport factor 2 family protein [Gammaproteobacteria bacterium]